MENTVFIGVNDIKEQYMPSVSKRKIRMMLTRHPEELHVKRNGNKILISRSEFIAFINNPTNTVIG